ERVANAAAVFPQCRRNHVAVQLFLPNQHSLLLLLFGRRTIRNRTRNEIDCYLGTMPLGNNQNASALFYDFSTRERPNSSGFSISAGLSTLSCQVNGLTLDYVGRPRSRRLPSP